MKAFVTGGAGFIGSHVVELLLEEGYEVTCYDNFSTGKKNSLPASEKLRIITGDVRNAIALKKAARKHDLIFHLAANVGNLLSMENPLHDAAVNIDGTINVLLAAKANRIRRLIFASSSAIIGETHYLPIDEMHPCYPLSPYGVSKLAAERYCLALGEAYGIKVAALRYFNVYGPRQAYNPYSNVIPIFIGNCRNGKPLIIYGTGKQTRDFVHVRDVARANLLAAEKDRGGAFNIATGTATTISRLAAEVMRVTGAEVQVKHAAMREGEVLHSTASIAKAAKLLKYRPQFPLQKGLRDYYQWITRNDRSSP